MALNFNPFDLLTKAVEDANEIGLKVQAATANQDEQVKSVIETSDDPKIVKFRDARAKVTEQIETLKAQLTNAEANIKDVARTLLPTFDPDFNVEEAKKEFAAKRKVAHDAKKALLNFVDEETLNAALAEAGVKEVISIRGTGLSKGAGTGVKRPRIASATVDGNDVRKTVKGEDKGVDFTYLAKELKTDADTLKKAAFEAAGTEDLNSLGGGAEVSFTYDGHDVTVVISDKKPGRKAADAE